MPRIATSGGFTIGVKAVPPMPPRLEIDIEAPPISSGLILRCAARPARSAIRWRSPQTLAVDIADHRHHQPVRRVDRNAEVDKVFEDQRLPSGDKDALKRGNSRRVLASAFTWKASAVSLTPRADASLFSDDARNRSTARHVGAVVMRDGGYERLCGGHVGCGNLRSVTRLLGHRPICAVIDIPVAGVRTAGRCRCLAAPG
jgi:hypothetical protein